MPDVMKILESRKMLYGRFSGHARIAQALKAAMQDSPNWGRLPSYQREALEMIQHKIARMLNGDPAYLDNAVDVAGYAELMKACMQQAERPTEQAHRESRGADGNPPQPGEQTKVEQRKGSLRKKGA